MATLMDVAGTDVVVAGVAAELVDQEGRVVVADDDDAGGLRSGTLEVSRNLMGDWLDAAADGPRLRRRGLPRLGPAARPPDGAGRLEGALATVLRVDGVAVTCAGRTDTGVHARGQVAHVDVEDADPVRGAPAARRSAADDVRVRRVVAAAEGFDARFSALWRRYAYRIADRPEAQDPLTRGYVLAWRRPLDRTPSNGRRRTSSAATTSRRSASSARARPLSARCSTCRGSATPTASSSALCAPTPSATTWSARSSAAWWRWARAAVLLSGRARCWRRARATRP